MSASAVDWVTAVSTCGLAVGGLGAFVYAVRTYRAQSAQLELAKHDVLRHRTGLLYCMPR
jgi:hypothetical protein